MHKKNSILLEFFFYITYNTYILNTIITFFKNNYFNLYGLPLLPSPSFIRILDFRYIVGRILDNKAASPPGPAAPVLATPETTDEALT